VIRSGQLPMSALILTIGIAAAGVRVVGGDPEQRFGRPEDVVGRDRRCQVRVGVTRASERSARPTGSGPPQATTIAAVTSMAIPAARRAAGVPGVI
jgi:hypothetical protein